MELRTERLVLRDFRREDTPSVLAYQSKPAYLEHYGHPPPTADDVRAFVELLTRWAHEVPRAKYQLAITLEGRVIGTCGVRKASAGDTVAEYGCELDPAFWGHGYAHEASRALITFGFTTLGLRRLFALTRPQNRAAIRLAQALGFHGVSDERYERGPD
ncbi:GNAT family N-acetyltransferase [Myxococcus sp. MISCRS1]|jgi:ribosomal-protein-alanine N-acetyltransferase|uniref:GNAT family N-acetyltransferase n=1 Tax=unclassified Myxococcus TaxID=2648731 RepID=UPI001CBB8C69|nr:MULTISPECIES: GNAT family N-acetyltransferase [unclassified Myxococcus]MBZ4399744.1 GNAT family N-acetyltransferase [Myxococcus sp. AS-1-15]MBZ4409808.1 GNAT family N-acetyltransferase [Myxococcus sp. XM-1-1-1]MCY0997758.1 GNAT family N-acetyltransferase [Myxococcus sp. MISCRS1]